ncbi:MAG: lysophospholipid acyltransferase family protein [Pseudomonadota bacterium]
MQPSLWRIFLRHHRISDLPVWLLVLLLRLLSFLPLLVLHVIAIAIGFSLYLLAPSRRAIVRRNLSACFPSMSPEQIRAETIGHFKYLCMGILTTGRGWWTSPDRLRKITRTVGAEEFEQSVSEGQNLILLAPHFAALEYGGIYLSAHYPMVSMYQKNKNPLIDTLVKEHRSRFGIIQYGSKEPIKGMIKQIKKGKPFYYLPDQDPGRRKGVFAPFFGVQAATFPALGRISRMGDAKIIPVCTRILPWGKGFEIIFLPSISNYPAGSDSVDTARMNRSIEDLVDLTNCQYFWSHKRFKTRPEGEPEFYS